MGWGSLENREQPRWGPRKAATVVSCPQVALRIRPLSDTELEEGATVIAHKVGDQVRLWGTGSRHLVNINSGHCCRHRGGPVRDPRTLPVQGGGER